jgi:Ricin-type beta-trefoil lectin domain-like
MFKEFGMVNTYCHGVSGNGGARRKGSLVLAALAASLAGCAGSALDGDAASEEAVGEVSSALSALSDQSLLITATSVTRNTTRTEDPCSTTAGDEDKKWTIGHMLKTEAARRSVTASAYVSGWMNAWTNNATVNGDTVKPLMGPATRDNWKAFAGGAATLPLHKAPFWLLAIVNRVDLRRHRPLGEPLGGELRFVFGFLGAQSNNPPCPTTMGEAEATMIVEYSPNKANENEVRDYARRWHALSTMDMSTSAYRAALEVLTEEVILNGKLMRIRTNELTFENGAKRWDLTEFEHNPATNLLRRSTVKQSPTMALSGGSQLMSNWIWSNRDALFANAFDYEVGRVGNRAATLPPISSYSVPDKLNANTNFRGGVNSLGQFVSNGNVLSFPGFFGGPTPTGVSQAQVPEWKDARFRFSVGTCAGCHGEDTNTSLFHVQPGSVGSEATRSAFLSGVVDVVDPTDGNIRQLNEMWRRENDLNSIVNGSPVTNPVYGNNYTVRFKASGKCLDSAGDNSNDGALSQLYACHGNRNQRLALEAVSAGVYRLKYKHSGKCIDVQNASTANGARVEQRTCNSARNSQKLTLDTLSGNPPPSTRVLRFSHSNLCLLVQNQATADATPIVQGTCPTSPDFAKGFDLVE